MIPRISPGPFLHQIKAGASIKIDNKPEYRAPSSLLTGAALLSVGPRADFLDEYDSLGLRQ